MSASERKRALSESAMSQLLPTHETAINELLNAERPPANLLGFGLGVKWKGGEPTGDPALVAMVSHKVDKALLTKEDLIPAEIGGAKTDVWATGEFFAGRMVSPRVRRQELLQDLAQEMQAAQPITDGRAMLAERELLEMAPLEIGVEVLKRRVRPAEGGYSVGHFKITAGTLGACVYDILPGGIGIPPKFYILSNNHVLANSNAAAIGDPILQPGPFDGGTNPADRIARLSRFVPIQFEPPIPLASQNNFVDCAVAEGEFEDLNREIYWTGVPRAWRPRAKVMAMVGHRVKKSGRTSNFTLGHITLVNATVDVNYGGGKRARFKDQIVTTNMSAPGDSGSLVLTADPRDPENAAVGLLYAGSNRATILNQIERVRAMLRVEIAELEL
jgi:hypothetical protein